MIVDLSSDAISKFKRNFLTCLNSLAGIPMEKAISSKTAVFAAGFNHDHRNLLNTDVETSLKHKSTGSEQSIISNRVSWFYDFHGPSVTVDTACSSGLVSLHLAAQSLKSGDSEMVTHSISQLVYSLYLE